VKTEEEIRKEIKSHWDFIKTIDFNDSFAGLMEADSQAWINALEWVLEDSEDVENK